MSLHAGQIVRYGTALYKVDYVNECRARIIPLARRHVVLADGHEFDSEQRGVNISPNSPLEIVEDIERTKLEIELEETERELAALKKEAEREAKVETARAAKTQAVARATARPATPGLASVGRSAAGWAIGLTAVDGPLAGTKAAVFAWVSAHPGSTTQQVAAGCPEHTAGAVAACLDRFRKIGVVTKK